MPTVTEQDVLNSLKSCYDPEIPVNIVDLGLIYTVTFASAAPADNPEDAKQDDAKQEDAKQDVTVDMTLTSQGCPEHVNISAQVKSRLEQLPGIRNARVNVVWTPAWTPERLSPDARKQLGIE
jgi:metal-sulfur cluster biosynthetic enzyme